MTLGDFHPTLEGLWLFGPKSELKGVHWDVGRVNCRMVCGKNLGGPESTTKTEALLSPLWLTLEKLLWACCLHCRVY